jgi:sec-independent protein translocase protein TatB
MFDSIGIGELAVICVVFILAVGPEKLPGMMKTVGKTLRTLRQASRDIRASTGIDELMRDDSFVLNAPRRQYTPPPGPAMVSRVPTSTALPNGMPLPGAPAESSAAPEPTPTPWPPPTPVSASVDVAASSTPEQLAPASPPAPKATDHS